MEKAATTLFRHPAALCGVGLAYYCAAALSLALSQGLDGTATIWPASGIFVAALLLANGKYTGWIAGSVAAASFAVNLQFGVSPVDAAIYTLANLIEGLLVSQLVLRTSGAPGALEDRRWVATFFGAALVGGAAGGTIATALAANMSAAFFISWFTTVSLGLLIVTPLIVTGSRSLFSGPIDLSTRTMRDGAIMILLVAVTSVIVFQQTTYPLLFLPLMAVLAATYRFGPSGAAISITIIAVAGTAGDLTGSGPTQFIAEGVIGETMFFQLYLLSLLCAAWPLSALLAEKKKLIADYAKTNSLLELAEQAAHLGHWYFDVGAAGLTWSNEVYRIHGVDPNSFDLEDVATIDRQTSLALYHPDDREQVREILSEALEKQSGFTYNARVVRPDGSIRHVSSVGEPTFDQNGDFSGLFGTFHDVTEQMAMIEALRTAHESAEREAKKSKHLAETDQLTGIANRRKVLKMLDRAVSAARRTGSPLTIAIFDVDHFKSVNDGFGHQAGDRVLKRIAAIASRCLRSSDFLGRLGGEEFLIVLPGETGENAMQIAERLRSAIANEGWQIDGLAQVTVSIGLASWVQGQPADGLLHDADEALYRAKNDGRNLLRLAA